MSAADIDLAIIVVNWNTRDLLEQCLQSVYATVKGILFEVYVVDNGSTDGSAEMVRSSFSKVRLIQNKDNVGFVRANNQAIELSQGRYVLLLNSDTRVLPGSLNTIIQLMDDNSRVGIAGVRLLNSDGSFQASYTPFPTLWREFLMLSTLGRRILHPHFPSCGPKTEKGAQRIKGYLEGAFLMARRGAVNKVGGLDERIFMYAEDVDWCYRFHQAGWEIWYLPQAPIIHHGGQSSKKRPGRMEAELYRSRVYFFSKHYGKFAAWCLKALIYGFTLPKMFIHRCLNLSTNGRLGRRMTSVRDLHLAFKAIDHLSR